MIWTIDDDDDDNRMQVSGLLVKQCKWIDSFTVPLWLVFQNDDPKGDPIYVIFKSGDDLRQDVLTLQMIRIIDDVCVFFPSFFLLLFSLPL